MNLEFRADSLMSVNPARSRYFPVVLLVLLLSAMTQAQTFTVLHRFSPGRSGIDPVGSLLLYDGKLYGTTVTGADHMNGTVFAVTGKGNEVVLHRFAGFPDDGSNSDANLIADSSGTFYGTTAFGGTAPAYCGYSGGGCGTVFLVDALGTVEPHIGSPRPSHRYNFRWRPTWRRDNL